MEPAYPIYMQVNGSSPDGSNRNSRSAILNRYQNAFFDQESIMTTMRRRVWHLFMLLFVSSQISATAAQFGDVSYASDGTSISITDYFGMDKEVVFPSTILGLPVTTIKGFTFYGYNGLESITLPASVTNFEDRVLYNSTGLKDIIVHDAQAPYSSLDGVLFKQSQTMLVCCPNGKSGSYSIPDSVTSIQDHAFESCLNLTNIIIPNGIATIHTGVFAYCTGLTDITIPNSVTHIGKAAFIGCNGLTNIILSDGLNTLDRFVFANLDSLQRITLPDSVTIIEYAAFNYCTNLASIIIPDRVTTLGDYAFHACSSLTVATVPDSVQRIGSRAFLDCQRLTNVTVGSGVTTIGAEAFAGCPDLLEINIAEANNYYSSLDGVLFNKSQSKLIQYPCKKTGSYSIPDSVTVIEYGAFRDCNNLTSLTVPAGITYFEGWGVSHCNQLKSIFFKGNAPDHPIYELHLAAESPIDASAFKGAKTIPTVYYLPGTSGWNSFNVYPTKLWNPRFTGTSWNDDEFSFTISGTPDIPIAIESSTNLLAGEWDRCGSTNLTAGTYAYTTSTNNPTSFYRIGPP